MGGHLSQDHQHVCAMRANSSTFKKPHSVVQAYHVISGSSGQAAPNHIALSATLQQWTQYLTVDKVSESYHRATLFACAAPCLNAELLRCVCCATGTISGVFHGAQRHCNDQWSSNKHALKRCFCLPPQQRGAHPAFKR